MADFDYLSSKILDSAASDVLSVLTASIQDNSTLWCAINTIVNQLSSYMVGSQILNSRAELLRLRLVLKIKQHFETNLGSGDDLHKTARDDVNNENLARNCVEALHELHRSGSENCAEYFTTICDILGLCLLTMPSLRSDEIVKSILLNVSEDKRNTSVLSANDDSMIECTKASIHLKVLETLIDVSAILKEDYLGARRSDKCFKDQDIHNFLLTAIFDGERSLAAQSLLSAVPKLIKLVESNEILTEIWARIAMFNGFDTAVEISRVVLVLVSLADYFLPPSTSAYSLALHADTKFWRILALALSSDDALLRKQALYLAKRADAGAAELAVGGGDGASRRALWTRFLVVVETLEEKQAHLALAVLPRVDSLLPANHESTPSAAANQVSVRSASRREAARLAQAFALVVYRRLLRHDQPAVAKWGVLRFLRADVHALCMQRDETDSMSMLRLAVSTLNTAFAFASTASDEPAPAVVALAALASWLPRATFALLLQAVAAQAWNPCALFQVAHALALATPRRVWSKEDVGVVSLLASNALATSGANVRAAVHCRLLSALVNLTDPAALGAASTPTSAPALAPALVALSALDRLALARGAGSWRQAVAWLKTIASADGTEIYVAGAVDSVLGADTGSPSVACVARGIVLLLDAGLLHPALAQVRAALHRVLANLHARAYASAGAQDRALALLGRMVEEAALVRPGCTDRCLAVDCAVVSVARDLRREVVAAIERRLAAVRDLREFAAADGCVFALVQVLPFVGEGELDALWETSLTAASVGSSPAVRQYLALQLLAVMSPPPDFSLAGRPNVALPPGLLLAGRPNVAPTPGRLGSMLLAGAMNVTPPREPSANHDVAVLHGRLVGGCVSARWSLLCGQLAAKPPQAEEVSARLQDCIDCLQVCAGTGTPRVALALSLTWPSVQPAQCPLALRALDALWTAALESRRTDAFWPAIRAAVAAVFHPLLVGQAWARDRLDKLATSLVELAQGVVGLANVLFVRLVAVADADALQSMDAVIVKGLLFGPSHRKDQRFEEETLASIKALGADCSVNELTELVVGADAKVRSASVALLLRATAHDADSNSAQTLGAGRKVWRREACARIALALVQRHDAVTQRSPRYYADSAQHRLRHRALQALLLVAGGLDQPTSATLLAWCWRCLGASSHQRSVRCQLEWLAARLTLANHGSAGLEAANQSPSTPSDFGDAFQELADDCTASQEPWDPDGDSRKVHLESVGPALACSALVVCALVARCSRTERDLRAAMERALASLAAQHFNQRLHAQVVFRSLWAVCVDADMTALLARFEAVDAALRAESVVITGNAQRNARRMHADFFLTQLDAISHVSVLSVCRDVPRMTGCIERLEEDELVAVGIDGAMPFRCRDPRLCAAADVVPVGPADETAAPDSSATDADYSATNEEFSATDADADVQRKPTPAGSDPRGRRAQGNVVLVASLIDKPANLGGLCRSCDVFGASLVVPRLALAEDKAFLALSVSSQRWVPLSEVRPRDLPRYLAAMKRAGFTLVGAEQTAGSVPVHRARFPRKTLLLLGNEKEGVPADLLPLLDACVEIPQQGVIRSLNVHVTGAIFLWEISRQHHLDIQPPTLDP